MVASPIEPHPDGDLHQRDNSRLHRDWTAKVALRLRKLSTAPRRRWLLASASPQAPAGRQAVLARHEVRPPTVLAFATGPRPPSTKGVACPQHPGGRDPPAAVHSPAVGRGSSCVVPEYPEDIPAVAPLLHTGDRDRVVERVGVARPLPTVRREVVGVRVVEVVLDLPLGHHEVLRCRRPKIH